MARLVVVFLLLTTFFPANANPVGRACANLCDDFGRAAAREAQEAAFVRAQQEANEQAARMEAVARQQAQELAEQHARERAEQIAREQAQRQAKEQAQQDSMRRVRAAEQHTSVSMSQSAQANGTAVESLRRANTGQLGYAAREELGKKIYAAEQTQKATLAQQRKLASDKAAEQTLRSIEKAAADRLLQQKEEALKKLNLASESRTRHILYGDQNGGGHLHGANKPGKTEFPADWSEGKIMATASDVATMPRPSGGRWAEGSRNVSEHMVDSVNVKVIDDGSDIITAYPTNGPRNSR